MNPDLIQRLVDTLRAASAQSTTAVDKALIDAAFLLEKSRGLHHGAWPAHVRSADVTGEQAESLKCAVAAYVRRTALGSWALGKSADPAQRNVLTAALRRHLAPGGDPFELYQALVALEDCGADDIFAGATCRSVIHTDANRRYARRFIERQENSPASTGNSSARASLVAS